MEETTIYQDPNIMVSNARLVLNGTTYSIRNLTSVRVLSRSTLFLGLILVVTGIVLAVISMLLPGEIFLWVAIPILVGGLVFLALSKPTYSLIVIAGGMEMTGLRTKDKLRVDAIQSALNQAIVASYR